MTLNLPVFFLKLFLRRCMLIEIKLNSDNTNSDFTNRVKNDGKLLLPKIDGDTRL